MKHRAAVIARLGLALSAAWGLGEKAAVAWLAGVPVVAKPALSTALVAHRIAELFVASGVLPVGAYPKDAPAAITADPETPAA